MEKVINITTAANSKTMNAVENPGLFAAASDSEAVINFNNPATGTEKEGSVKNSSKSKRKQKAKSSK